MALKIPGGPLRLGGRGGLQIKSGGAAAFDPASLSPLLWLKADAIVGKVDGDSLTGWNDSSGNARNSTATAGAPKYKTNLVNGKPAVLFSAAIQEYFTFPSIGSPSALTAFAVVKDNNDPPTTGQGGFWAFGSDAQGNHYPFTDSTVYDGTGSTARKTVGNPTPSLAAWRLVHVVSAANSWQFFLDGTSLFSTATNTVGILAAPLIGQGAGGRYHDGHIAEIFVVGSALSAGNQTSMKSYLATKYGLTVA